MSSPPTPCCAGLGFEVYLQKDLSPQDREVCIEWINKRFIAPTCADPKFRYMGMKTGGFDTGLWRGRYGWELDWWPEYKNRLSTKVVFRRISKNKRKFACVYADELVVKNDKLLDKVHDNWRDVIPDGPVPEMNCGCPRHKPSIKVTWKNRRPDLQLYARIGEIRGMRHNVKVEGGEE